MKDEAWAVRRAAQLLKGFRTKPPSRVSFLGEALPQACAELAALSAPSAPVPQLHSQCLLSQTAECDG